MSPSLSPRCLLFLSLCSLLSSSWPPLRGLQCSALLALGEGELFPAAPPNSSRPLCSQAARHCGGGVAQCQAAAGKRLARKELIQAAHKAASKTGPGQRAQTMALAKVPGVLGESQVLPTLLTPFVRLKPGLGSEQHIAVGEAQTGQQGLPDSHTS